MGDHQVVRRGRFAGLGAGAMAAYGTYQAAANHWRNAREIYNQGSHAVQQAGNAGRAVGNGIRDYFRERRVENQRSARDTQVAERREPNYRYDQDGDEPDEGGDGEGGDEGMDTGGGELREASSGGGGGSGNINFKQQGMYKLSGGTSIPLFDKFTFDAVLTSALLFFLPQLFYPFAWTDKLRKEFLRCRDSGMFSAWSWNYFKIRLYNKVPFTQNKNEQLMITTTKNISSSLASVNFNGANVGAHVMLLKGGYVDMEDLLLKDSNANYKGTVYYPLDQNLASTIDENGIFRKLKKADNSEVTYRDLSVTGFTGTETRLKYFKSAEAVPSLTVNTFDTGNPETMPPTAWQDEEIVRQRNHLKYFNDAKDLSMSIDVPKFNQPMRSHYVLIAVDKETKATVYQTRIQMTPNIPNIALPAEYEWQAGVALLPWMFVKIIEGGVDKKGWWYQNYPSTFNQVQSSGRLLATFPNDRGSGSNNIQFISNTIKFNPSGQAVDEFLSCMIEYDAGLSMHHKKSTYFDTAPTGDQTTDLLHNLTENTYAMPYAASYQVGAAGAGSKMWHVTKDF